MAETKVNDPLQEEQESKGTNTMSRSEDNYAPEEHTTDIPTPLLQVRMPETPESTKDQVSDGASPRLESPKLLKPVLGKVQAKKRLMAFANKFNILPKVQNKQAELKHGDKAMMCESSLTNVKLSADLRTSPQINSRPLPNNKPKKKPEEKILAIEEIRREESKSRMLLAEALAAANLEEESSNSKSGHRGIDSTKSSKEFNKNDMDSESHRSTLKSSSDSKYERQRRSNKRRRSSTCVDSEELHSKNISSQERESSRRDRERKDKRDDTRLESSRSRREDEKDKRRIDHERCDSLKTGKDARDRRSFFKEKKSGSLEQDLEIQTKINKEKDTDNKKDCELMKSCSWVELKKCGITFEDIIEIRRRDYTDRLSKIRTSQDYVRYFEQMLMLNDHRLKRSPVIVESFNGPKEFPPESVRVTKRGKPQVLYSENPRISLLLNHQRLLQSVTEKRREKIQKICATNSSRINIEDTECTESPAREWYPKTRRGKLSHPCPWELPVSVQLPKSKWDSEEDDESTACITKESESDSKLDVKLTDHKEQYQSAPSTITDEFQTGSQPIGKEKQDSIVKQSVSHENPTAPLPETAGDEKLVSEYEQFMKMVCSDISVPNVSIAKEYSPKKVSTMSTTSTTYDEFNLDASLPEDASFTFPVDDDTAQNSQDAESLPISNASEERHSAQPGLKISQEQSPVQEPSVYNESENHLTPKTKSLHGKEETDDSKSVPSDWENVRIKVERASDENTDNRSAKRRKKRKRVPSSSDSSSTSSSSDSEKERKKRKRKRKLSKDDSTSSDSDSSETSSSSSSSSSSDSSSSDDSHKKRRKRKKKASKRKKKAKRAAKTRKKRRRKVSTDSSSSDSDRKKGKRSSKHKKSKSRDLQEKDSDDKGGSKSMRKTATDRGLKDNMKIIEYSAEKDDETKDLENRKRIASDSSPCRKSLPSKKDDRRPHSLHKNYFEEWQLEQMLIAQQSSNDSSKIGEVNQNSEDATDIRIGDKKDVTDDINEKRTSEEASFSRCVSIEEDMDKKKRRRREKDKRSSTEYLANWDKESDNESKVSRHSEKLKRDSWGETEFDTLNVLSLTQLEKEVSKQHFLADQWEVDSLEGAPNSTSRRRRSRSTGKKLEKEVRYDKSTDTYISIDKEAPRECKKKRDPLCAIRIWEEEQEEGEKEEMMLQEEKLKRKRSSWDLQVDDTSIHESSEAKENIPDGPESPKLPNDPAKRVWTTICSSETIPQTAEPTITDQIFVSPKKAKKSRWDMGSQVDDKIELKQPVMWEEESEWAKSGTLERSVSQERAETLTEKNTFTQETLNVVDDPTEVRLISESSTALEIENLFLRKPQNVKLLETSWQPDERSNEDSYPPVVKEHPRLERLKDLFDLEVRGDKRGVQLYSPSSPALSQKSESNETSNDTTTNTSESPEESTSQDSTTKEDSAKSDENSNSTSNESPQISKLHADDIDSNSSTIKQEYDEVLDVNAESKKPSTNLEGKTDEDSPTEFPTSESFGSATLKDSRMDIFAEEFEAVISPTKIVPKPPEITTTPPTTPPKNEESPEVKASLKLIPKQFLIKRTTERPKSNPDYPLQDLSELLAIQKKRLEERFARPEAKNVLQKESLDEFKIEPPKETDDILKDSYTTTKHSPFIDIKQVVKIETEVNQSDVKAFDQTDELPVIVRKSSIPEIKKSGQDSRDKNDTEFDRRARSPSREQKRKSPSKRDYDKYDHSKDKKDSKYDERERSERRDSRGSKEYSDRRRSSPASSRSRRRRSTSPGTSWERERSSESCSRSWSRSRSKSPRRKDDKRSSKLRAVDEKKDRSGYTKDFKKYGSSSKSDRDDGKRKYGSMDKEHGKESKSYELMDRESTQENDSHKDSRDSVTGRFRREETDRPLWPYEGENVGIEGNEAGESYSNEQDLLGFGYDDRSYYDENIDRDIFEGPMRSASKYGTSRKGRLTSRRDRPWDKDVETSDSDRHGRRSEKYSPPRNRSPGRARRSPHRKSHKPDRLRRSSRSRSKSWSRSRSRSRTRSRSRSTSKTRIIRTRSRSRSRSGSRSRNESTSRSAGRNTDTRRASSLDRNSRDKKDDTERGRRIETIVQSVSGLARPGAGGLDSESHMEDPMGENAAGFQYMNESETGNEYYYTENNLTYPPCIDDTARNSPKRLSLDDRLELELGIKKQQESSGLPNEYPEPYNSNLMYSSPSQQQPMVYRQQPTVVQVGNVLQVVPGDFNGVSGGRKETPACSTPPIARASSQVVRVGNVLQVVPTSLDWNSGQSSSVEPPSGLLYPSVPQTSAVPSVPVSVPVPVPVPMPVPIPPALSNNTPVSTLSPVPIPLSIPPPVPVPIPIPATVVPFVRAEPPPQKTVAQPVYNYEAILEARRKEREERKQLREIRRKEKERKRIERINRRALRLLEKTNPNAAKSDSPGQKTTTADPSVLKALIDSEENFDKTETEEALPISTDKDEETPKTSAQSEEEEVAADEDEDEDEEEEQEQEQEPEVEEDDEEEEEPEPELEEEDEDEDDEVAASSSRTFNRKSEPEDNTTAVANTTKSELDVEARNWPSIPPAPLKGILVASGFRKLSISNGNLDDGSTGDEESDDNDYEDIDLIRSSRANADDALANTRTKALKPKVKTPSRRRRNNRKSVQFADGIKPGEGTSPSGGEGDMPSPPPPSSAGTRSSVRELRRSSRKSRKQEKRAKPPKTKKKVKVKIIKLKKPRITPLTAMMMDDSDELDDRSPPPPPPGSPPPPHLWPSYLSSYNSAIRTPEPPAPVTTILSPAVQAPPPPTPLPLLVPPPPLNYTIQPCSKA